MDTLRLAAGGPETVRIASAILQNGGLVALPTETVYGLGGNGLDPAAVRKIFEAKGRPQDNPLILHVASASELDGLCHSIPAAARELARRFWPGPLTMVLPGVDSPGNHGGAGHRRRPLPRLRCHPRNHPGRRRPRRRPLGQPLRQAEYHHRRPRPPRHGRAH